MHACPRRCMKSVIFVIDEFDRFARKGKQVLLYNLLDVLQHSKVQVRQQKSGKGGEEEGEGGAEGGGARAPSARLAPHVRMPCA
jgi:hypothetical protein